MPHVVDENSTLHQGVVEHDVKLSAYI